MLTSALTSAGYGLCSCLPCCVNGISSSSEITIISKLLGALLHDGLKGGRDPNWRSIHTTSVNVLLIVIVTQLLLSGIALFHQGVHCQYNTAQQSPLDIVPWQSSLCLHPLIMWRWSQWVLHSDPTPTFSHTSPSIHTPSYEVPDTWDCITIISNFPDTIPTHPFLIFSLASLLNPSILLPCYAPGHIPLTTLPNSASIVLTGYRGHSLRHQVLQVPSRKSHK